MIILFHKIENVYSEYLPGFRKQEKLEMRSYK